MISKRYDSLFMRLAGRFDWRWIKAQAMAESNLYPRAVSPVGAMGLMQIMPATWAEICQQLGLDDNPYDPETNIKAGVYYMGRMYDIWRQEVGIERLRFAWGSYNAGAGNILKAQSIARPTYLWSSIVKTLPQVTGEHATETINYVKRIEENYEKLTMG